jgi:pimeloyl-ACP methyl ester carboxylesterase
VIDALALEVRPISFTRATREVRDYSFGAVSCPIRATKGDVDRFSADSDLELWRSMGAVTTVIPDCGHFGNVERPFEVLEALYPRA